MPQRFLLVLAVSIVCSLTSFAADPIDDTLNYKAVDGKTLRIDWTRPVDWKSSDRRSAVVFMHGGGWVGGQPGQFSSHSQELAMLGVVCFRVQYRLLDRKQSLPPVTCTQDVSDAMRFIRSKSGEFGIDPNRVAAAGGSAGGHLAAFLGMMDDQKVDGVSRKPNALCLFNPVYDNGPGEWGAGRVKDRYAEFSPAHNITSDDPPALVFLGTRDSLIPVSTSQRFRQNMLQEGVRSELVLFRGQAHGFFNSNRGKGVYYRLTVDRMIEFLDSLGWFEQQR